MLWWLKQSKIRDQKGNHSYFREIISIFTSIQVKTTPSEFATVWDLKSQSFYGRIWCIQFLQNMINAVWQCGMQEFSCFSLYPLQ